jgi:hypothetical protein
MTPNIATPERIRKTFAQKSLVNTKLPQRSPVGYDFDPIPSRIDSLLANAHLEKLIRILIQYRRRGISNPAVKTLAKRMCKSPRQILRYLNMIESIAGKIRTSRHICRKRCTTNTYNLEGLLSLMGDKSVVEKKGEKDLNTKTKATTRETPRAEVAPATTAPKTPPPPSKTQLEYEAMREFDRECTRKMLRQREARFEFDRECKRRKLASYEAVGKVIMAEISDRLTRSEQNRRWWREGDRHRWDDGREHRREQGRQRCSQAQAEASALSYWERPDVIARIAKQDEDYLRKMGAL